MTLALRLRAALLSTLLIVLSAVGVHAQSTTAQLDALLTATHDAGALNGTVLVSEAGAVIYEKGFGAADMSWAIPNGPDTRFRIASVTKQFTAALVMQLVEQGLLDLDAPVTRYLPDYPAAQGGVVTIHQLLSHTSGIPEHVGAPGFDDIMRDPVTPDDFLDLFSSGDLDFEPGSQFSYSNSGYIVLGVIIEHVTGQTYADALRTRLFEPLGLTATGYDDGKTIIPNAAGGYVPDGLGTFRHAPYIDPSRPYAAGMISSTARDLDRWTTALHHAEPFGDEGTLARMLKPVLADYAYGIGVSDIPMGDGTVRAIGHDGGIPGFSSFVMHFPESNRTVVVLDNTSGNTRTVAMNVAMLLHGQSVEAPKPPISQLLDGVIQAEGLAGGLARYRDVQSDGREDYDLAEEHLNSLGYAYLQRGETDAAVEIFRLNAEAYPDSWNTHDSLGEALLAANATAEATVSYRRALALNPTATSAIDALRTLGVEASVEQMVLPLAVLQRHVGRYALGGGMVVEISLDGMTLFAQPTGRPKFNLTPLSESRFFVPDINATVTFEGTAGGRSQRIAVVNQEVNMTGERIE